VYGLIRRAHNNNRRVDW